MPNETLTLDRVFHSLANSTRRSVVATLGKGSASMTELAGPFDMALPSFLQHLEVLEKIGMVSSEKSGRIRTFQLEPAPLIMAEHWMDTHRGQWETRLNQLDQFLVQLKEKQS